MSRGRSYIAPDNSGRWFSVTRCAWLKAGEHRKTSKDSRILEETVTRGREKEATTSFASLAISVLLLKFFVKKNTNTCLILIHWSDYDRKRETGKKRGQTSGLEYKTGIQCWFVVLFFTWDETNLSTERKSPVTPLFFSAQLQPPQYSSYYCRWYYCHIDLTRTWLRLRMRCFIRVCVCVCIYLYNISILLYSMLRKKKRSWIKRRFDKSAPLWLQKQEMTRKKKKRKPLSTLILPDNRSHTPACKMCVRDVKSDVNVENGYVLIISGARSSKGEFGVIVSSSFFSPKN